MKKWLNIFISLTALMFMIFSTTAFASTEPSPKPFISHSQYLDLQSKGAIGEDISYEQLKELYDKAVESEKNLERNANKTKGTNILNSLSSPPLASLITGDILITNGTTAGGILGHAGIAISSTQILHIAAPGETVKIITPRDWTSRYNKSGCWTQVYRSGTYGANIRAANWAKSNYPVNSSKYVINTNLAATYETYCSKIVWQAYYYGAAEANLPAGGFIPPYDLTATIYNLSYVGNLY